MQGPFDEAVTRFAIELVSRPKYLDFARTQGLKDAKSVSEFIRGFLQGMIFEDEKDFAGFPDMIDLLIYVSDRKNRVLSTGEVKTIAATKILPGSIFTREARISV